jgi:transcriptional regulator with XRE-family HTH domain
VTLQKCLPAQGAYDFQIVEATKPRTPQEDLARIQEVLSPAVTNLAEAFGVTRQAIYNWRKGEAVTAQHAAQLQDLAQAADVFAAHGITVTPTLLNRRFAQGRTLLQVSQAGESTRDAALMLATILNREESQRIRMKELFDRRHKHAASEDFDLPHADLG